MATVEQAIGKSDIVELIEAVHWTEGVGKWPAGTTGTVVEDYGDRKPSRLGTSAGLL